MKMDGQLVDEERHDDEYSSANRPMMRDNLTKNRTRQIKPACESRNAHASDLALPTTRPSRSVAALVPLFSSPLQR
jgi:hypothetical protein